jgi:hypothetical protein
VDQYLQQRFLALGAQALTCTRLYLDTNYWADLRDHIAGIKPNADRARLLFLLRTAVGTGRAICTYSSHTLDELMKHASTAAREATARLIDELSQGFCVANPERLLSNEIVHWIVGQVAKKTELFSLTQMAWTRPFFIAVDFSPSRRDDVESEIAFHRFVDSVWCKTLGEIVAGINVRSEPYPISDWSQKSAELINDEEPSHTHEGMSFKQLYLDEMNGVLEWSQEILGQRYKEAAEQYRLDNCPSTPEEVHAAGLAIRNALFLLAQRNRLGNHLASLQIRSRLIAAVRHDRRRRFKPNDFLDFEHALTALPHCNYFLTDGPHADLIKKAKLDGLFGCRIIPSVSEACRILDIEFANTAAHAKGA